MQWGTEFSSLWVHHMYAALRLIINPTLVGRSADRAFENLVHISSGAASGTYKNYRYVGIYSQVCKIVIIAIRSTHDVGGRPRAHRCHRLHRDHTAWTDGRLQVPPLGYRRARRFVRLTLTRGTCLRRTKGRPWLNQKVAGTRVDGSVPPNPLHEKQRHPGSGIPRRSKTAPKTRWQ